VDIWVEEISSNLIPLFFHSFKGIDGAVGATDVEEKFHSIGSEVFLFRIFSPGNAQFLFHLENPVSSLDDCVRIE
jgi:hypothetical protein